MFLSTLEVLGVNIKLSQDRFTLSPCKMKLKKCLDVMLAALAEGGVLRRGCASKLAGRLHWSSQYLFHRLGRAMIRPIFAQCHSSDWSVGNELRVAFSWWGKVLELGIVEERFWKYSEAPLVHTFVDACWKIGQVLSKRVRMCRASVLCLSGVPRYCLLTESSITLMVFLVSRL